MKKVILGIVIGVTLSFTTSVFANSYEQYILTKATYPIFINNVKYENASLPVLNYHGNTYVPLKSFGHLVQKKVAWNPALQRVEISQPCSYLDESGYYGEEV